MKNRQNSFCCGSGSRGVRGCEGRACKSQNIWKINFPSVVIFCYRICFGIRSMRSWRLHLGLFGEITCCETIGKIVIFCSPMQILHAYSACRFCMQIMLPTIIPSTHRPIDPSMTTHRPSSNDGQCCSVQCPLNQTVLDIHHGK
jgi:hypothetical protein